VDHGGRVLELAFASTDRGVTPGEDPARFLDVLGRRDTLPRRLRLVVLVVGDLGLGDAQGALGVREGVARASRWVVARACAASARSSAARASTTSGGSTAARPPKVCALSTSTGWASIIGS